MVCGDREIGAGARDSGIVSKTLDYGNGIWKVTAASKAVGSFSSVSFQARVGRLAVLYCVGIISRNKGEVGALQAPSPSPSLGQCKAPRNACTSFFESYHISPSSSRGPPSGSIVHITVHKAHSI